MLTVGDQFPDFKLTANVGREKGKEFKTVTNKDFDGKWLVFYAYPKDFTFICPTEIVEFGKHTQDFADRDAVVLGGSTDNEYSHLAWRNAHPDLADLPTPLVHINPTLANELGIIHKEGGVALRVTFVVDPNGVGRLDATYSDLDREAHVRHTANILRFVSSLSHDITLTG